MCGGTIDIFVIFKVFFWENRCEVLWVWGKISNFAVLFMKTPV